MNKLFYNYCSSLLLLLAMNVSAADHDQQQNQEITISGTVADDNGSPLPGTTIQIVGTSFGGSTNADGNFRFGASLENGEYELKASFVSFEDQVMTLSVDGRTSYTFDFVMTPSVLGLDEVVVVGSTVSLERKKIGNNITTIKSKDLTVVAAPNVPNAIQGKVPGAQIVQNSGDPAGGFSIRLRGPSTIQGSSEPLYVIDGVVVSNLTTNVTNINVSAGDAVPGQNRMVDFNPNDIESMNVLNGAAAAAIYGSRASNGVVIINTKKGGSEEGVNFFVKSSFNINRLRKRLDMNLEGAQFESGLSDRLWPIFGRDPVTGANTPFRNLLTDKFDVTRFDYQDLIFDTGYGTGNYVSGQGRSGNIQYFGSVGYTTNGGIIRNTQFNRFTGRAKVNHIVNDLINYEVGLVYTNGSTDEKPDGNVFWSPINSVNITNNIYNPSRLSSGELPNVEGSRVNPLSVIEDFDITQEISRIVPHLKVSLTPIKGLQVDQVFGLDSYTQEGNIFIPEYEYAGVNPSYFNDGYKSQATADIFNWNYDANAIYTLYLTSNLISQTTLGFNYQSSRAQLEGAQGRGLDASGNASIPLEFFPQDERLDIFGGFLQQSFEYKDRYFVTFAGRIDGATNFDPDERANFYPKVSASYLLSNEPFWDKSVINSLRLRSSYGEAGNLTAIGPYSRFGRYQGADFLGGTALNQESQLGNLALTPERTKEFEIGTDVSVFNSRFNLLFSYYSQNIEDLIVNRVTSPSIGGTSRIENVGTMENEGIEFYTNYVVVKTNKVTWDLNFNFSRNRNKVTSTNAGPVTVATVAGATPQVREGEPLGVFFGTYYARDINGNLILDENGLSQAARDPETGDLARRVIGNPNPDYILAASTDLSIGNFSFGMLWESVQGVDVFDADHRTRQGVGIGHFARQELTGEIPRGSISAIYPIEEYRIVDGSFIKLREVYISYDIPEFFGLRDVKLSMSGRNLVSIDDFPSYDPETNSGGQSNLVRAVNFGSSPIPQIFTFSISTNF